MPSSTVFASASAAVGRIFFEDIRNGWWQTPDQDLSRRQLKRRLNVLNGDCRETSP